MSDLDFPYAGAVALFFFYGLAFFLMGFAILGEAQRADRSKLATSLLALAAFGFLHSVVEWSDMFGLIFNHAGLGGLDKAMSVLRAVLLPISIVPLLLSGLIILRGWVEGTQRLWMLVPTLIAAWLVVAFLPIIVPEAEKLAGGNDFGALQRWQEAWARYLLYFPASLLAALGFAALYRHFTSLHMPGIARYSAVGATAFLFNAFFAGLVVPEEGFPLAHWLNYTSFNNWVGAPTQVFRAASAVVVAFSVTQMLRFFELTQRRRLQQASQEAFHLQEQARLQAEQWGRTLKAAVEERTRQLEALATINADLSSLLELDKVLDTVVEKAQQLMAVDVATVSLLREGGNELAVRSAVGARTVAFRNVRMGIGHGVAGKAVAKGEAVFVEEYSSDTTITHELDSLMETEGLLSHLAVPLRIGDKVVGAIFVATRSRRRFVPTESELLSRLGQQAAIALENARLYQQVQDMAALKERERLARELHDSIAQVLGYLRVEVCQVEQLIGQGDEKNARQVLKEVDRVAELAYEDVREAILGLRSTALSKAGLVPLLKEYVETFSIQNQLEAEVKIEPGLNFSLLPKVEIQLMRIVQEALTNVRKHSKATRVTVTFSGDGHGVEVVVKDNGCGFDRASVPGGAGHHFGLYTMRERAESVGGRLDVDSAPGKGTRVVLWVPSIKEREVEAYATHQNHGS